MDNFSNPLLDVNAEAQANNVPQIKIVTVGVGGAGCNTVNRSQGS